MTDLGHLLVVLFVLDVAAKAKVGQLDRAERFAHVIRTDQHVAGRQVAVNHPHGLQVAQGIRQLLPGPQQIPGQNEPLLADQPHKMGL